VKRDVDKKWKLIPDFFWNPLQEEIKDSIFAFRSEESGIKIEKHSA
jgi:hypothetical protein